MIAVPKWLWIAGGALVLTLLLLWRANALVNRIEQRGYDRAIEAAAQEADRAGKAMAAQLHEAEQRAAQAATARTKQTRKATDAVSFHYSTRPDDAGALALPDDRVRASRKARADIAATATPKRK